MKVIIIYVPQIHRAVQLIENQIKKFVSSVYKSPVIDNNQLFFPFCQYALTFFFS